MIKVTVKFVTEKKVTMLPLQLRKKSNIVINPLLKQVIVTALQVTRFFSTLLICH